MKKESNPDSKIYGYIAAIIVPSFGVAVFHYTDTIIDTLHKNTNNPIVLSEIIEKLHLQISFIYIATICLPLVIYIIGHIVLFIKRKFIK